MNRRTEFVIISILIMLLGSTLRELLRAPKELDRIVVADLFNSEHNRNTAPTSSLSSSSSSLSSSSFSSTISDLMMMSPFKRYSPTIQEEHQPNDKQKQQHKQQQQQQQQQQIQIDQQQPNTQSASNVTLRLG